MNIDERSPQPDLRELAELLDAIGEDSEQAPALNHVANQLRLLADREGVKP